MGLIVLYSISASYVVNLWEAIFIIVYNSCIFSQHFIYKLRNVVLFTLWNIHENSFKIQHFCFNELSLQSLQKKVMGDTFSLNSVYCHFNAKGLIWKLSVLFNLCCHINGSPNCYVNLIVYWYNQFSVFPWETSHLQK